jgi:hypothetical protein
MSIEVIDMKKQRLTEERRVKTTLRLPHSLWVALRHRGTDEGASFQTIAERALVAYLKGGKS